MARLILHYHLLKCMQPADKAVLREVKEQAAPSNTSTAQCMNCCTLDIIWFVHAALTGAPVCRNRRRFANGSLV